MAESRVVELQWKVQNCGCGGGVGVDVDCGKESKVDGDGREGWDGMGWDGHGHGRALDGRVYSTFPIVQ